MGPDRRMIWEHKRLNILRNIITESRSLFQQTAGIKNIYRPKKLSYNIVGCFIKTFYYFWKYVN